MDLCSGVRICHCPMGAARYAAVVSVVCNSNMQKERKKHMASYDLTRIPALRDLQELGRRQKNVTDGLGQRVSALETNAPTKVGDLTNDKKYQTETEVSAAINKAVAAADHLKRKSVASTGDIDLKAADAAQYIYMVPKGTAGTSDKYDEYMVIDGVLEKMGDWKVDLSGYVQKEAGKGLSTNDYTSADKQKVTQHGKDHGRPHHRQHGDRHRSERDAG